MRGAGTVAEDSRRRPSAQGPEGEAEPGTVTACGEVARDATQHQRADISSCKESGDWQGGRAARWGLARDHRKQGAPCGPLDGQLAARSGGDAAAGGGTAEHLQMGLNSWRKVGEKGAFPGAQGGESVEAVVGVGHRRKSLRGGGENEEAERHDEAVSVGPAPLRCARAGVKDPGPGVSGPGGRSQVRCRCALKNRDSRGEQGFIFSSDYKGGCAPPPGLTATTGPCAGAELWASLRTRR